ncbi:hypothetical protein ES703_03036 [subsurface metagenome]
MKKYQFTANGLPPKKDGAQSMWGKPLEAKRLVELRRATLKAIQDSPPLQSNIRLTLKIYVDPTNDRHTGDLDTFITGVCDGLMAVAPGGKLDSIWDDKKLEPVHPSKTIAIVDDSQVVSIQAEKVIGNIDQPWYEVILEGEL